MSIRRTMAAAGLLAAVLTAGCAVNRDAGTTAPSSTTATTKLPLTTAESTLGPVYDTPKPSDFHLSPKVLERENFGELGPLITVRVVAAWDQTYDPAKTYEVTYEILGGEDGPEVDSMEIQGETYDANEHTVAAPSNSTRVRFRVLSVEEV